MSDARTGALIVVTERARAPLPAAKAAAETYSLRLDAVATVLDAMRAATVKSRAINARLRLTVEIEPDGTLHIVPDTSDLEVKGVGPKPRDRAFEPMILPSLRAPRAGDG